jgi:hypothetical protein
VQGESLLYDTQWYDLWPTFQYCKIESIDLSESYRSVNISFSGTPEQKSAVSVVHFDSPTRIEFLPKEMLNDFPRLNGLVIERCKTFTILKEDFFIEDFGAIQYLGLGGIRLATIEPKAFQHLPKLKWIHLGGNQLSSLPHQIFKNNPELIAIWLFNNGAGQRS